MEEISGSVNKPDVTSQMYQRYDCYHQIRRYPYSKITRIENENSVESVSSS